MKISTVEQNLKEKPQRWLVTGAAGFVGSHLAQHLSELNQDVVGIDNFITGLKSNVERLKDFSQFKFIELDIRDYKALEKLIEDFKPDVVLHQAALGSVPRSIDNPLASHDNNVNGFLNVLDICRKSGARLVYASSSSVYGDSQELPKVEDKIGEVLSPYAATKFIDEIYASVFNKVYKMGSVGLRYFNVFGPYQNPEGAYAAVIPKWFAACMKGERPSIYGDGETSRDFCYIENVVQANILAAESLKDQSSAEVYNVAAEQRITLNQLLESIQNGLQKYDESYAKVEALYEDFRKGDVRHSLADVSKAHEKLGYKSVYDVHSGLDKLAQWYISR